MLTKPNSGDLPKSPLCVMQRKKVLAVSVLVRATYTQRWYVRHDADALSAHSEPGTTCLQEAMPSSLNSTRSSKAVKGGSTAEGAAMQLSQGLLGHTDPTQDGSSSAFVSSSSHSGRLQMASASSSDSETNRQGELLFLQPAVPSLPADQHALNDLSELRARVGVAMHSPDLSEGGGMRRAPPSRASSWGSSRAGSALRRSTSKLASTPETAADQLTLQGMSIV